MTKMRLFIRIFTRKETIEINPDDFETIQDVILHCLTENLKICHDNLPLFGLLEVGNGHWIRPGLKLTDLHHLDFLRDNNGFSNFELRIRFRFPPYIGGQLKCQRAVRHPREKLYEGPLNNYLLHQTRFDLMANNFEFSPDHPLSSALGVAIFDYLRIKYEDLLAANTFGNNRKKPKLKNLLPPKNLADLERKNFIHVQRHVHLFNKSVKDMEKKTQTETDNDFNLMKDFFQDQYLVNLEPLLRAQDWGECFKCESSDSRQMDDIWVHPEHGIKLKRNGESDWINVADYADFLTITRVDNKVEIWFKNFTNVSIDLKSPSHAVDLLLYLEGITSLLVTPHHYYNSSATWPFLLEESAANAFGPIPRDIAESLLENGQCLLRRCGDFGQFHSFFITAKNQDGEFSHFKMKKMKNGYYSSPGDDQSFENLEKLIEYCRGLNLPFDIDKRISPFTTGPNRLQIIRASVVHGIERTGHQSVQGSLAKNIEIQPSAMYDETDMDIGEPLKQKQSQKFFFTSVKAVSIKRPSFGTHVNTNKGGFDQQAIIKRLTADSYQHSLCMTSLHTSFKNSLHFLLQVNHSHIIRYIGIASGHGITGGHILEKAAFGSLDRYIKMKCREHQERSKDKDDYYDDEENNYNDSNSSASSSLLNSGLQSGTTNQTASTIISLSTQASVDTDTSELSNLTLKKKKKRRRNWQAWMLDVFWTLAAALDYLETKKLVHANVRASNILLFADLPQPHIKLADPGVTSYRFKSKNYLEMCLAPPWKPIECMVRFPENPDHTIDKWGFATTISEISSWCQESDTRMGYPEESSNFSNEQNKKYQTGKPVELPDWINEVNVDLEKILKRCWHREPRLRPSCKEIVRELNTALQTARKLDKSLPMPVATNPSVMHETANVERFYDSNMIFRRKLGQGHFGVVDLCTYEHEGLRRTLPEMYAVKSLKENMRTEAVMTDFANEFRMMGKFDHKNIVRLRGICLPSGRLVMEYIESGSLFNWLTRNNKEGVQYYTLYEQFQLFGTQICEGMDYLHSKKCIHRDLAARNVMVAHDTLQPTFLIAKISDFGLSKQISKNNTDDDTYYYRGNPDEFPVQWYAPECLQQALFTFGSDVWSFGVTLWEIFSFGQKPNYKQNGENLNLVAIFKFLEDGKRLERVRPIPKDVYDVMLECWHFDHSKRPTFRELFQKISRLDSTNFN